MRLWVPVRWLLIGWVAFWLAVLTGAGAVALVVMTWLKVPQEKMQWVGRYWAKGMLLAIMCPVEPLGMDNLDQTQNYVFASNHTSAIDILALMTVLPANFRWIAKKELFEIPVFGPAMLRSGFIPIDRSDHRAAMKSLNLAAGRIRDGASVVIFPEGTRTEDGNLLPFKSGGLALAIKSGRPVTPVAIIGAGKSLPPNTLHLNPGAVQVRLGHPIPTEGMKLKDREDLAVRLQEKVQELLDAA